ncbi:hypothetical protein [Phormidium sp. CCY1219]|nr:hypothetical protein [Phormidium sp. CCY1219]
MTTITLILGTICLAWMWARLRDRQAQPNYQPLLVPVRVKSRQK